MGAGLLGFEEVRRELLESHAVYAIPENGVLKLKMALLIDANAQGLGQPWAGVKGELWASDEFEAEFKLLHCSDPYALTWEHNCEKGKVFWKCEVRANYLGRIKGHQSAKYASELVLMTAERQLMRFIAEKILRPDPISSIDQILVVDTNNNKRVIWSRSEQGVEYCTPSASSPADETRAACEAENRKKLDRRLNYPW